MNSTYPKKYWWIVLVAVPLLIAAIAIVPKYFEGSGKSGNSISIGGSDIGGDVQLVGTQNIYNQIRSQLDDEKQLESIKGDIAKAVNLTKGDFYQDAIALYEQISKKVDSTALLSNLSSLYLQENRTREAKDILKKGISLDPEYQPFRVNLARVYIKEGENKKAIKQLNQAPNEVSAKQLLVDLEDILSATDIENEPNNTIFEPNIIPVSGTVTAYLPKSTDTDFYQVTIPGQPRDIYKISLENHSDNLKPYIQLWLANKKHFWKSSNYSHETTASQDIQYSFSPNADTTYYISVSAYKGEGKYILTILPTHSLDDFEPNDSAPTATPINTGDSVIANIMDGQDSDYYLLKSNAKSIAVQVVETSPSLKPRIDIWQSDKSHLKKSASYSHEVTRGQDVTALFNTNPNENYYISVSGFGTKGKYVLKIIPK